jgi:pyrimidine deaminase RibD-like protein
MELPKIRDEVLQHMRNSITLPPDLTPLAEYPTPMVEYTRDLLSLPSLDNAINDSMSAVPPSDPHPRIAPGDHVGYMQYCLSLAKHSPPKPTNYRVGALLLDEDTNTILATGYTLELEGNTHAEQCCLIKLAEHYNLKEEHLGGVLSENTVLYTTVEPCFKRLSGNLPCVERILHLGRGIKTVYVGLKEPEKFVGENTGRSRLEAAGIKVVHVEGLEPRILEVATAGHKRSS